MTEKFKYEKPAVSKIEKEQGYVFEKFTADGSIPNEAIALETLDKYLIITLVDKYQAFIDREGKNHDETIEILKKMAKTSHDKKIINHGDKTYNLFLKYISILEKHPEIAVTVKS